MMNLDMIINILSYNDESGYDYEHPQQIVTCPMAQESTCMVLNEETTDAAMFVSTCCEEAASITFAQPTAPLVINSDECFPVEGLCDHNTFQLQQNQNSEQVNVVQENNIEEAVPLAQYHNDDVTSYSEEGATNFQDYTGANFSSTLADLQNDSGTQPQLPICIDESGYDYQIGSTCMALNEGNTDAAALVSDQWSLCCEEQVQNLEEAGPITFTECFPMEGLFDTDDFIAADLSWASDLFD
ncbi:hypothetical protein BC332_26801 [Capsicum chinense]|nr:hypothetical protein BC332_26801 [Capsicum chinense]